MVAVRQPPAATPIAALEASVESNPAAVKHWQQSAVCRELPTEMFFSDDLDDVIAAKLVCLGCPVQAECLADAVAEGNQYGVRGGHLFEAGRIVMVKRRRGRPPKHPRPGDRLPAVPVPEQYRHLTLSA